MKLLAYKDFREDFVSYTKGGMVGVFFVVSLIHFFGGGSFAQEERPPYSLEEDRSIPPPSSPSSQEFEPLPFKEVLPPSPQEGFIPTPPREEPVPSQEAPPAPKDEPVLPPVEEETSVPDATEYEIRMTSGIALLNQKKYVEAQDAFRRALGARPGDSQATYFRGITLAKMGKHQEAEKDLLASYRMDPKPEIALDIGVVYYQQKEHQKALDFLNKAEKGDPTEPLVYFYQGRVYQALESHDWAAPRFLRAAAKAEEKKPPLAASAHYQAGVSYYRQGIYDEAKNEFLKVLQREPRSEIGKSSKTFIEEIEQKKKIGPTWTNSVSISHQYDGNVVLEPSNDSFAQAISRSKDHRTVLYLKGDYLFNRPFPWGPGLSYYLYQNLHYKLHPFDVGDYGINPYLLYSEEGRQFRLDYLFDFITVDFENFLDSHTLRTSLVLSPDPERSTRLFYQAQHFRFESSVTFPLNPQRDGVQHAVGATQYQFVGRRAGTVQYGYLFKIKNAATKDQDFLEHQLSGGIEYPLFKSIKGEIGADLSLKHYKGPNTFSNSKREDDAYTIGMGMSSPFLKSADLSFRLSYRRNNSNIPIFDYNRTITSLSLTWNF